MLRNSAPMLAKTVQHQAVEKWEKHEDNYANPSITGSDDWYDVDNRLSIFVAVVASYGDRVFRPMVRVMVDFHAGLVHRLHVNRIHSMHLLYLLLLHSKLAMHLLLLNARLDIHWLLLHARLDIHWLLLHARLDIHWLLLHARLDIHWLLLHARLLK